LLLPHLLHALAWTTHARSAQRGSSVYRGQTVNVFVAESPSCATSAKRAKASVIGAATISSFIGGRHTVERVSELALAQALAEEQRKFLRGFALIFDQRFVGAAVQQVLDDTCSRYRVRM